MEAPRIRVYDPVLAIDIVEAAGIPAKVKNH
jgi:hypothetical protein